MHLALNSFLLFPMFTEHPLCSRTWTGHRAGEELAEDESLHSTAWQVKTGLRRESVSSGPAGPEFNHSSYCVTLRHFPSQSLCLHL